jgi:hypothetical protein
MMTATEDFTADEWRVLRQAPASAGVMVMAAERGETPSELRAIADAYSVVRKLHGRSALLDEICQSEPEIEHFRLHSYEGLRDHALRQLREATSILKAKGNEQELGMYRAFVVGLAERVARAHVEEADPVSEGERVAIELIDEAMG